MRIRLCACPCAKNENHVTSNFSVCKKLICYKKKKKVKEIFVESKIIAHANLITKCGKVTHQRALNSMQDSAPTVVAWPKEAISRLDTHGYIPQRGGHWKSCKSATTYLHSATHLQDKLIKGLNY